MAGLQNKKCFNLFENADSRDKQRAEKLTLTAPSALSTSLPLILALVGADEEKQMNRLGCWVCV